MNCFEDVAEADSNINMVAIFWSLVCGSDLGRPFSFLSLLWKGLLSGLSALGGSSCVEAALISGHV